MRRHLLLICIVLVVALAGCSGGDGGGTTEANDGTTVERQVEAPQVSWSYDNRSTADEPSVVVNHDGGEMVTASEIAIRIGDSTVDLADVHNGESMTAGDRVQIDASHVDAEDLGSGSKVRIVWERPGDGETEIINSYLIP